MCGICGCGESGSPKKWVPVSQANALLLTPSHSHSHTHRVEESDDQHRLIQMEVDLLSKNNAYAEKNRAYFKAHGIFVLNLVSSPGAGKTTLLVETIKALASHFPISVIEGDQQTEHDAQRIRATGARALQINTGRVCHLEAQGIAQAVAQLGVEDKSFLAIENVGNLVCPSAFDLGEAHKVVVLSVTEGDDKPIKYADMFYAADLMIINKMDLLPYVDFDVARCIAFAKQVNPSIEIITLSTTKGDNFAQWTAWLQNAMQAATHSPEL
ncbi:MAG TPA: hydrogenase accessory protein HypB [Methylococcaceae bacterium]|nr:hydrogenase accessory protein HypB [Methylococcaceae bacterium]